jgi:hypothetical protein
MLVTRFFCGEGPRSRCYGRTAALRLIVQPLWWRWWERWSAFSLFPSNGAPLERNWQGKTELLGEKPVPAPHFPPQIPHWLTRDRTRASAVRGRRLIAWTMARLSPDFSLCGFDGGVQFTMNTSIISICCSNLQHNSSVRYTYWLHGEFTSVLHIQETKTLLSNCFIQQLIHSLMMDLWGLKHVGV